MADDKVFYPEVIAENPLPDQSGTVDFGSSQSSSGEVKTPTITKDQTFPIKRVAVELIGSALNTRSRRILGEFQFTEHGAIQVGKYTNGVSGDIRISPNGIVARNSSGITTFAIDGDTGDAIFKGTVQAGSLISESAIEGGSININDKFTVDEDGVVKITDDEDQTVIDAKGLVSGVAFSYDAVAGTSTQSTNSTTFADITGMTLTFTLPRVARVLFLATVVGYNSHVDAGYLQIVTLDLDGSDVGPNINVSGITNSAGTNIYATTGTTHYLGELAAGEHTIKLQFKTTNATGTSYIFNRQMTYLILGK